MKIIVFDFVDEITLNSLLLSPGPQTRISNNLETAKLNNPINPTLNSKSNPIIIINKICDRIDG
jgi:hypothetical protein